MQDPLPPAKPTATFVRRHLLLSTVVVLGVLLLATCQGITTSNSSPIPAAQGVTVKEVPVTVEVTRIVVTERIIPATPEPPKACAPAALDSANEVVIAALLPLGNADMLTSALASQAALSIASSELNSAGGVDGKPVRVWSADVDAARAGEVVEEAVVEQCAAAILVAAPADVTQAVIHAAETHGTPVLILDAVDDALTADGSPVVFRLAPSMTMLTRMYAEWLQAVGDYNGDSQVRAALVVEDSAEARERADMIGAEMQSRGIGYEVLGVPANSDDFSSLIARIALMDPMPDAIFIRLNGDAALTLQQQLLQNGIGPQKHSLIVTMRQALETDRFWQQMGEQGIYTVVQRVGPWSSTLGEGGTEFAGQFAMLMGRWPEASAFAAHDAVHLIADAVTRAKSLAPGPVIHALEASDISLAGGHYTFPFGTNNQPDGDADEPWMWRQWRDMPLLFLQYTAPNQSAQNMIVLWPPDYATTSAAVVRPPQPVTP